MFAQQWQKCGDNTLASAFNISVLIAGLTPTIAAWSRLAASAVAAPSGPALKRVDRSRFRADAVAG